MRTPESQQAWDEAGENVRKWRDAFCAQREARYDTYKHQKQAASRAERMAKLIEKFD